MRFHSIMQETTIGKGKVTRLVYKVRLEGRYSASKFPLKLRPLEDELLSSWVTRLALLHRTMPMTFTNLYLPETKNRFWSVDIDLQADPPILAALSQKSGTPVEELHQMTLKSYEGYLFEKAYRKTGGTPFVQPLGLRGRRSTLPGLRYCPECLLTDKQPYFRKKWRLALSIVCLKHLCYLRDRCPTCSTPLTPYLACKAGGLDVCYKCGSELSKAQPSEKMGIVAEVTERLFSAIMNGFLIRNGVPTYSHLYFQVLHQMLKLMSNRRYGAKMREAVGLAPVDVTGRKAFELMQIKDQAEMLVSGVWLLDEWPERFVAICNRQRFLSSALLRDLREVPFWYWKVVTEFLYRPDRLVTNMEIKEALNFMRNHGIRVTEAALSKIVGVQQVFRKRVINHEIKSLLAEGHYTTHPSFSRC